jgi:hypothetical protein
MAAALELGAVIFAAAFDAAPTAQPIIAGASPISPNAQPIIARAVDWRRREPRFGLPRKETMALFGHESTRQLAIEANNELQTFLDGGKRLITADSIAIRMIALALLSHPFDGSAVKIRQPPGRFQKQRREPTPQELAALKRANDARKEGKQRRLEEAQQRREAKAAARV